MTSARIALVNTAQVDTKAISDVAVLAELPSGRVRLIVGDSRLPESYQGATIARVHVSCAGNIFGLEDHLRDEWDVGVVIGAKWASLQSRYPAYFAYLLAHEFGHAKTALTDLGLTIYEDLILSCMPRVAPERHWRWDDMPHEVLYDRFGIAIAGEIFGREVVEREFAAIVRSGLSSDIPRMEKVLRLPPIKDLSSLRNDLATFSAPYKEKLLSEWQAAYEAGRLPIASGLRSLQCLWGECGGAGYRELDAPPIV